MKCIYIYGVYMREYGYYYDREIQLKHSCGELPECLTSYPSLINRTNRLKTMEFTSAP